MAEIKFLALRRYDIVFNPSRRSSIGLLLGGFFSGTTFGSPAPSSQLDSARQRRTEFGANSIFLFRDSLDTKAVDPEPILAKMGRLGLPFVRFAAGGQWAGDWDRYAADPKRYWTSMDKVFAAAEQHGVGLVPSVFWNIVALSHHHNEPVRAWAEPNSQTRTHARLYSEAIVSRYDRSPALKMYEFANELNDWVDLPNLLSFWPKPDPTRPNRRPIEQDRLNSVQLRAIYADFAETIRRHSSKPIGTGSNMPRRNAWHLARGGWNSDTARQFIEQYRAIMPPEINILSMHAYEEHQKKSNFETMSELLAAFAQTAALDQRKSFLGEFGVPALADRAQEHRRFAALVGAIDRAGIDYAALWNVASLPFQREWDVWFTGSRAYQLEMILNANKKGMAP